MIIGFSFSDQGHPKSACEKYERRPVEIITLEGKFLKGVVEKADKDKIRLRINKSLDCKANKGNSACISYEDIYNIYTKSGTPLPKFSRPESYNIKYLKIS